jgi:spore coat polysaccharide biosynthesis protein SpsF
VRVVATVEARMSSSRLPGKVLLPALDRPMLHHLVKRLKAAPSIDDIVLATTEAPADDVLERFARDERIRCFRGSEDDVMQRVIGAATSADADVIVEITGDCPIIDPQIVGQCLRVFAVNAAAYVSNVVVRTHPDGMDVQVFALETLKESAALTTDPLDREHVTLHIRNHPELFPQIHVMAEPEVHWPDLGLTLDEPGDYELLKRVIEHFGDACPLFGCRDVVRLLRANPAWLMLNQSVRRKCST